mgnify:FL=1
MELLKFTSGLFVLLAFVAPASAQELGVMAEKISDGLGISDEEVNMLRSQLLEGPGDSAAH